MIKDGLKIDICLLPHHGGCTCGFCLPLTIALPRKSYDVTQYLIESYAKRTVQRCYEEVYYGFSLYGFAVLEGTPSIILEGLLRCGSSTVHNRVDEVIEIAIAEHNSHPLHRLLAHLSDFPGEEGSGKVLYRTKLKTILKQNQNLNHRGERFNGNTLHLAAVENNPEAVDLLLQHGVNIDCKNMDGIRALHRATHKGDIEITPALINRGADLNAQDHRLFTPFLLAIFYWHEDVVLRLLKAGADLEYLGSRGNGCLFMR